MLIFEILIDIIYLYPKKLNDKLQYILIKYITWVYFIMFTYISYTYKLDILIIIIYVLIFNNSIILLYTLC